MGITMVITSENWDPYGPNCNPGRSYKPMQPKGTGLWPSSLGYPWCFLAKLHQNPPKSWEVSEVMGLPPANIQVMNDHQLVMTGDPADPPVK